VHPEWVAADYYELADSVVKDLRALGFTHIQAVPDDGIFRGQSSLIDLDDAASITVPSISQVVDFKTRGRDSNAYPSALLGTIAVMRQTLYDAEWYGKSQAIYSKYPDKNESIKENLALDVLAEARSNNSPFLLKTGQETAAVRAIDFANEFGLNLWLKGSGFEYRRLTEIAKANPFIILPINFPGNPDIANPHRAFQYTTEQLKHWDLAPNNAAELVKSGVRIALTSSGLKNHKQFRRNLSLAVQRGLSEEAALAALTTNPAGQFGLSDTHGKIKPGYHANFVIVDGNYFDDSTHVRSIWIRGQKYEVKPTPEILLPGIWDLSVNGLKGQLEFKSHHSKLSGTIRFDSSDVDLERLKVDGNQLTWSLKLNATDFPGVSRFTGRLENDILAGTVLNSSDAEFSWMATNFAASKRDGKKSIAESTSSVKLVYPEGAYGFEEIPEQVHSILINDATLWTSGPKGILKDWDMLIIDGKISKIARDIEIPRNNNLIIDGRGKFVTAGLIDAHSHTAASSINEGAQSVTSEVRIQDVLDPDDISIYREMAGGLTTINILHGSANVIGGQNAVIKLRWGSNAQGLLLSNAPRGIKFALGENVKQSNWGDDVNTRYPQTRMGVEQILRDAFTRARDYKKNWQEYDKKSKWRTTLIPPRKDLELDALVEVLEGKRLVHCHSYRQDEILMLTRVAEDFGFTVRTFQHVLEGYKIAERIAEHGAGASTFSDWWAYKFEVYDAIPYNGALMHAAGVLMSFNSDSYELARRMNLEAAKGVKYGGMSEIDALNAITINPAKQLGIDKWVGSLEEGKDADFVVWTGHPLSTQSVCDETWIDGRQYFSLKKDAELLARDKVIRQLLTQKILMTEDKGNISIEPPPAPHKNQDNCLTQDDI
ncbi:amidohydrolase family protein, partial [bacterium]|nr:amidohydrolase family protein [bacterium]